LITRCCAGYCPYFSNISVGCYLWLLHAFLQNRNRDRFALLARREPS
jgi:hypothetical protein